MRVEKERKGRCGEFWVRGVGGGAGWGGGKRRSDVMTWRW